MGKYTGHTITSDSALGGKVIEKSLRFNGQNETTAPQLRRTGTTTSSSFSISMWAKLSRVSDQYKMFFSIGQENDANAAWVAVQDGQNMGFQGGNGTYTTISSLFRDPSSWFHFLISVNSNNFTVYIDGTSVKTGTMRSLDTSTNGIRIGANYGSYYPWNGYLADVYLIDGQAKAPTDFGYTESQTGIWRPKKYTGTFGTGGAHLEFKDSSSVAALGKDTSGNGNDFTPTTDGFSVTDSVIDSPSNNFATWNVVDGEGKDNSGSWSEGNLKVQIAHQGNAEESGATLAFSSGKWYWEQYMQTSTDNSGNVGVGVKSVEGHGNNGGNHWRVRGNGGETDHNGTQTTISGFSWTNGDIIGIAVDMDAGTWTVSKNGTFIGSNIHTNLSGTVTPTMHNSNGSERHTFITNFGQDSSFAGTKTAQGNKDANGIGDFYYPVPSGYQALCSANLPPNVSPIIRPQRHFDILLYTGTGSSNIVEGLEFSPDMVWVKGRDTNGYENMIIDSVRGGTKSLVPNGADPESSHGGRSMTFYPGGVRWNSDSGNCNANGENYVLWCWKGGGTAVSNTDGSVTSTVSANPEAGFSIVQFESQTTNIDITVGHGLGRKPAFWMWKSQDNTIDWYNYHTSIGYNGWANNSTTGAAVTGNGAAWKAEPTSTVLTHGSGLVNQNTIMMYVWAEIPGFSKFGKYKGNNNADGPYIHLGFRPAWVMIKNIEASSTEWYILDSARDTDNPVGQYLSSSATAAEATYIFYDFLSDGFKLRNTGAAQNPSSQTIIYMAFAEAPGTTPFGTHSNIH